MKKEKLQELKKIIESIDTTTHNIENIYCELINATIDYQNDTQDWKFEGIFEDYIDDELLSYAIEYNLKKHGIWAVKNLLQNIKDYNNIYKVDAYGYGYDVTNEDLKDIKENILATIEEIENDEERISLF